MCLTASALLDAADAWARKKPARDGLFSVISEVLGKYKQHGAVKFTDTEIIEERRVKVD